MTLSNANWRGRTATKLCCALLLAYGARAQTENLRIHRVDEHLYRGKQPTKEEIPALAQMGIKTVLDLRGGVHKAWERRVVEAAGMRYVRIGLSGIFAPTGKQMNQILALLDDPEQGPVFIHCRRGADRSGVVIACYRIAHDHWTNAQAWQEARQQGFSSLEVLMRRYIQHFTPQTAAVIP